MTDTPETRPDHQPPPSRPPNVGRRLTWMASQVPEQLAIAEPRPGRSPLDYRRVTFRELDKDSEQLARGLRATGLAAGTRVVLLVRPGIDFVSLVVAMLKARLVMVLIDPGMGRRNLVRCLSEVQPDGFVAIPAAHAVRVVLRRRFSNSRVHVTVGRKWFWGGPTLAELRQGSWAELPREPTNADDPAAIIFTTGSTGPPKGVLYRHGNFNQQIDEIQQQYAITPGETDLPGFPLFALFNCVMGVSTVIPRMDFTRPAQVDPRQIIEPVQAFEIPQSFGSPALWTTVGRYCEQHDVRLPSLRRILSAGAPVPVHVLQRMIRMIHPEGDFHTPYGATEALPVATISAREVLRETAESTAAGRGTCVGKRFPGIRWKVIEIDDGPLTDIADARELPRGQIGELMVQGPVVTDQYVTRTEANALHKVRDGDTFWHRMGDVGYLDDQDRFWFCGRKAHRVETSEGTLYTVPCEAIFNQHRRVYRSALVGVGHRPQRPVVVVETWPEHAPRSAADRTQLLNQLRELAASDPRTQSIRDFLWHRSLPVDIRHNSKIFREKLVPWAARRLRR